LNIQAALKVGSFSGRLRDGLCRCSGKSEGDGGRAGRKREAIEPAARPAESGRCGGNFGELEGKRFHCQKAVSSRAGEKMHEGPDFTGSYDQELNVEEESSVLEPRMYRVILHNDHYTTMDFVVLVLMAVFHKPAPEATRIMLNVHTKGHGVCGVYTYDVASTKIARVHFMARQREYPLRCSMEEV